MVKPSNGRNYKTFIFDQYFKTIIEGSLAAMEDTIRVISLINALPKEITLNDEDAIVAARAAYDKIMTLEQKSLVSNYSTLTGAESTLKYLKNSGSKPVEPEEPENPEETKDSKAGFIVTIVLLSAAVVGLGCLTVFSMVRGGMIAVGKFGAKKKEENPSEEEKETETVEVREEQTSTSEEQTEVNEEVTEE